MLEPNCLEPQALLGQLVPVADAVVAADDAIAPVARVGHDYDCDHWPLDEATIVALGMAT